MQFDDLLSWQISGVYTLCRDVAILDFFLTVTLCWRLVTGRVRATVRARVAVTMASTVVLITASTSAVVILGTALSFNLGFNFSESSLCGMVILDVELSGAR